ncbi:4-hydroxybenzoate 3-monooxygenase [Roseococcus sp. SYP-B2431]|uniref:4-hydroxybenzoate 3-monooxygenase n=1 Tax=Roseococcus sp. SYP-B2431 TaxID=2496640 RepID=UPI00103BDBBC|nr:4-hydroxybenzoate 3-monooxygenase [Roseococcus sp. SYP-B2431]TCI00326.1 4-hydroxybenzoate 3-monooxygenase [Roseococcus sp. SYP-B2431]
MRTQVGIVGAGPAGLLLAHLLHRAGIDSVVLEARSRPHIEGRIRAGLLEQGSVDTLVEAGLGDRLLREGLAHDGLELRFDGGSYRIDLHGLTGRRVTIYGQQEAVKDMVAARLETGRPLHFEVGDVTLHDIATGHPRITWTADGVAQELRCDIIAGCDGFHGPSREAMPPELLRVYERVYPFAWLGILAEAPPISHELIYARHAEGFALATMRSASLSRLYLQCAPDEDLSLWPDGRIWESLVTRLGAVNEGRVIQKGVTGMRSFVAEPMRHGRLFLAGDAAHIVPPTGAKGMNLAVADVRVLAAALTSFFRDGDTALMDRYSDICLKRVWKVQRFSWWMTSMLHRYRGDDPFEHRVQVAELDYLVHSKAAQMALAEQYVGLPYDI